MNPLIEEIRHDYGRFRRRGYHPLKAFGSAVPVDLLRKATIVVVVVAGLAWGIVACIWRLSK
jgi:hypothetical protein